MTHLINSMPCPMAIFRACVRRSRRSCWCRFVECNSALSSSEADNLYFQFAVPIGQWYHGAMECTPTVLCVNPPPPPSFIWGFLGHPLLQAQHILPAGAGGCVATRDSGPSGRERTGRWRCHLRRLCCWSLRRWHGESSLRLGVGPVNSHPKRGASFSAH